MPWEFGGFIQHLKTTVVGADNVIFSTHCHNDLGLSTANSLSGAMNGARQVECTVNGIGERAGNAALEEIVMAIALKGGGGGTESQFKMNGPGGKVTHFGTGNLHTGINNVHITGASRMVAEYTGMQCQPHKAIVGVNAFKHESGIHQDGMIKNKATYEIMTPESIGLMRGESNSGAGIVLGKHSGRNAVATRLKEMGYVLDKEKLNAVFVRFKEVAEKKKGGLEDDELEALVSDTAYTQHTEIFWTLKDLQVTTGMNHCIPTATVTMLGPDGITKYTATTGTGPVDAVYKAIDNLVGLRVHLDDYGMQAVNEGIDALATTRVSISPADTSKHHAVTGATLDAQSGDMSAKKFSGSGSDQDVVVSSARAYTSAINKLLAWNKRRAGAEEEGKREEKAKSERAEEKVEVFAK